jgi:tetratricopeptide (TPR) repeat protein
MWALVIVVVIAVIGFGVYYYMSQRVDSGPTQVERVVAISESAVRENPNDVNARLGLAAAYLKAARPDEAKAQFLEILKAQPENRSALLGVAGLLYESGDFGGAKDQYTNVITSSAGGEFAGADTMLQEAYYFRGMSESALKDYSSAGKDLQQALTIDKADADAWYALGNVQLQSGDGQAAASSFQQGLLFVPTGWCEPYTGLKAAYEQVKNADGVTFATAMGAICNGDGDESQQQALEKLIDGEFKIPALLGLGLSAETSGDTAAATKWYREVLKDDPKNITANSAVARLAAGPAGHATDPTTTPSASAS